MTASLRFDGALNVDLNEFQTNLVPFPRYAIKSDFFYILTLMKYLHIQGASKSFLDKKKLPVWRGKIMGMRLNGLGSIFSLIKQGL